jgi:hypothetical protein
MILKGFFKCPCGKIHTHGGLSPSSVCPQCGRELYTLALTGIQSVTVREHIGIREIAAKITKEMEF